MSSSTDTGTSPIPVSRTDAAKVRSAIIALAALLETASPGATVEVPVSELRRLMERQQRFHAPLRTGRLSRIERDSEVVAFIAERAGQKLLREIADECRQEFGTERAPSQSAIHRYIQRLARHHNRYL